MQNAQRVAEVRSEELLTELLTAQGWDTRRPPSGEVLRQHEYKDYPSLLEIFQGRSKSRGAGPGLPEAVLVDSGSIAPIAVIEAKARKDGIERARKEARDYAKGCIEAGYQTLAIGLAGNSEDGFAVSVSKWKNTRWSHVTYEGNPIGWIPNRADMGRLLPKDAPTELRPSVPPPEVLAMHADEINRLLRESGILDQLRPAHVGAIMLALWQSRGEIRRSPAYILKDINEACGQAFWKTSKSALAASLAVDEANQTLAVKARRIVSILERLNVSVLTAEHDYLGQLYETFFQYTGANTIGQFFTPRHIAVFMADLLETDSEDVVLDPACGTGGFLIAAMYRVHKQRKLSREQVIRLVGKRLIGFDHEPITAALCVANMILRGDGSTGIHRGDSFTDPNYPTGQATALLMNPPFPHSKTDTPPEKFLFRGLEGLSRNGHAAVIMPTSRLVKKDKKSWRKRLLEENTLEAVIGLPDDLFEPFASSCTGVVVIRKGVRHDFDRSVFFARITNDGFEVHKRVKVPIEGEELARVLYAFREHADIPGLCGWNPVDGDSLSFGPGLYVPPREMSRGDLVEAIRSLARNRSAFVVRHAPELFIMEQAVARGDLEPRVYQKATPRGDGNTIGDHFDTAYGQRKLHSKRGLEPGVSLVISSSGVDNGCYGFFDFDDLIAPPFATVPSTGSIGQAHVQQWPCGVTDDCLILTPKDGTPQELLYVAAAVIRSESWRYSYGMKITPERIRDYPLPNDDAIVGEIQNQLRTARKIEQTALQAAEDDYDEDIAAERVAAIRNSRAGFV